MNGASNNYVYALDIGTRKIAGVLLDKSKEPFSIIAAACIEQEAFSMEDGQIHDIDRVSKVIRQVTQQIERDTGLHLTEAAAAAAGRSLRTEIGRASRTVSPLDTIEEEQAHVLELEAVMDAREKLRTNVRGALTGSNPYIFVAYSVTHYTLDGDRIGSLIGQRGSHIGVEVIATFLPRMVVDSLTSALNAAGLKMTALTLEPLAALHIAIPPSMRALNLALVDIGAGTSDIAITKDRTVVAYGMVPNAGDEITSVLMEEYLLDFAEAERVKRSLAITDEIAYVNVLGIEERCSTAEMRQKITPAVEKLASEISEEVLRLNGGTSPQAVMMIGGGSLTYGIDTLLAAKLNLPKNRIAVRDRRAVSKITGCEDILSGPESITSLGIAALTAESGFSPFIDVYINGQEYKLLKSATHTVKDAVIGAGVGLTRLLGAPGEPISVVVNGKTRVFPGTTGEPAKITKNGQECSLSTPISAGDTIEISQPIDGTKPQVTIAELLASEGIEVPEDATKLQGTILRNGKPAGLKELLEDGDVVEFAWEAFSEHDDQSLANSDIDKAQPANFSARLQPIPMITITLNGQPLTLEGTKEKTEKGFIVNDIFRYHDPTTSRRSTNRILVIRVNGKPAGFTTPLSDGDRVELQWR